MALATVRVLLDILPAVGTRPADSEVRALEKKKAENQDAHIPEVIEERGTFLFPAAIAATHEKKALRNRRKASEAGG
jgi:hypothetical protein